MSKIGKVDGKIDGRPRVSATTSRAGRIKHQFRKAKRRRATKRARKLLRPQLAPLFPISCGLKRLNNLDES